MDGYAEFIDGLLKEKINVVKRYNELSKENTEMRVQINTININKDVYKYSSMIINI